VMCSLREDHDFRSTSILYSLIPLLNNKYSKRNDRILFLSTQSSCREIPKCRRIAPHPSCPRFLSKRQTHLSRRISNPIGKCGGRNHVFLTTLLLRRPNYDKQIQTKQRGKHFHRNDRTSKDPSAQHRRPLATSRAYHEIHPTDSFWKRKSANGEKTS